MMLPTLLGTLDRFSFYEHCDGQTFAIDMQNKQAVSVDCGCYSFPYEASTKEKICKILANFHVELIHKPNEEKIILSSDPIFTWKKSITKNFNKQVEFTIPLRDGGVAFFFSKELIIIDFIKGKEKKIIFNDEVEVSAAAETSLGNILFGDFEGNIYIDGKRIINKKGFVNKIILLSEDNFLAEVGRDIYLCNTKGEVISELKDFGSDCNIFLDGTIYVVKNSVCYQYFLENSQFVFKGELMPEIVKIRSFGEEYLLLNKKTSKNPKIELLLYNRIFCQYIKGEFPESIANKFFKDSALLIRDGVIAFEAGKNGYGFYDFNKGGFFVCPVRSEWAVIAACRLSNGLVACCTNSKLSKFSIFSDKRKARFGSVDLMEDRISQKIYELPNSDIAIVFQEQVLIMKPEYIENKFAEKVDEKDIATARKIYGLVITANLVNKKKLESYRDKLFNKLEEDELLQDERKRIKQLYRTIRSEVGPPSQGRKYRRRLLVGEGEFLFAEALIKKHEKEHPKLRENVLATCYESEKLTEEVKSRVEEAGLEIRQGFDATKINNLKKRFERIQWNCPFGGKSEEERINFFSTLPLFFQSASKFQESGDRVHIVLTSSEPYRQLEFPFLPAATLSKYRLIRKRRFGAERYPGYIHKQTDGKKFPHREDLREFVFEKTDLSQLTDKKFNNDLTLLLTDYQNVTPQSDENSFAIDIIQKTEELEVKQEKSYQVKKNAILKVGGSNVCFYYDCSTDEDSSDYYSSDSE